ncbi:MAG: cold shock domain-containing protein [Blastocatellia bacterium]|nr:cold shock domain-containing protein [Blastocatellia bacterium]
MTVLCSTLITVQAKNRASANTVSRAELHTTVTLLSVQNKRKGTVKFFNPSKGFGFIVDSVTKEEFMVHVTGLIDEIREGDTVTFKTENGRKGMNAVEVQLAK